MGEGEKETFLEKGSPSPPHAPPLPSKNFYQGEIRMNADGYPCTTKSNKDYHGYGIKSIRMVTEKYDGSLSIRTKGDIFNLNILIPIPKSANA